MITSISTLHPLTDDPDAPLGLCREAVGLEHGNEVAKEGLRWIAVGAADEPDIRIQGN